MKIALLSPTPVPPTFGGMDRLLEGLAEALRQHHPTDLVTIPCDERSREGVLKGYYDFYHLDLSAYDRVISYKAPAYMVRHPNQVMYLSHRLRVFYDLYEPADEEHARLRELIHWMDGWALDKRRIPYLYTVGETVSRRLRHFGNIDSVPVHHPTTFKAAEPRRGEYFLSVGRLHPWKRVDLIIKAFRECGADCPLKIAGEGPHEEELRELAAGDSRIEFVGRVSDEALAELYSRSLVTVFPPINEDMGLITFEAFLSGKPILTTSDSGEPALIVEEGRTGFIAEPTVEAMAAKMTGIWNGRDKLEEMEKYCLDRMKEITWDRLVEILLNAGNNIARRDLPILGSEPRRNGRPHGSGRKIRLLVTDNQIIDPPLGGGRVRILELYRHMPEDFATTYVGAFDYPGPAYRDQMLAPNFREILTPLTTPHFKAHHLLARLTGGDATIDVTMPLLGGLTPRYQRLLREHLSEADVLVSAHPWMIPFLPPNNLPLVYDSQNCEAVVKGSLLRRTMTGRYLIGKVKEVEARAIKKSRYIFACSEEDRWAFVRIYNADPAKILDAPNGVDCSAIRPPDAYERRVARARFELDEAPFILFTGSNYVPNLEGAEFIAWTLAPEFPEARFGIVGGVGEMLKEKNPGKALSENVRLFGFVEREDLLSLYRAADLALNPMRQGSGTNIKMLDYMAAGLPILTTPKGARGIKGVPGEHWIEDELNAFAVELRALLDAPNKMKDLGENARALAERAYDWRSIAESVAAQLRELARGRSAAKT